MTVTSHSTDDHDSGAHNTVAVLLAPFFALVLGAVIRQGFQHLPIPYTVLLLVAGSVMGACIRAGWGDDGELLGSSTSMMAGIDPHLMLHVFLPPLIFESAFSIELNVFQKVKYGVLFMAGPGLLFCTFLVGYVITGMYRYNGADFEECDSGEWTALSGLLLGCILSATDPVAVVALLKDLGVKADLSTAIEGESLLNDGTAVVIFLTLLDGVESGAGVEDSTEVLWNFVMMSLGGVALGVLFGAGSTAFIGLVFNDALVEITITIASAYLTFFVAENVVRVSGVLAVVALGLYLGSVGRVKISPQVNHFLEEFWELMAFIGNTLIFVIAGVVIAYDLPGATLFDYGLLILCYIVLLLARVVLSSSQYLWEKRVLKKKGVYFKDSIVCMWGGLRGAVGLALALVVFESEKVCSPIGDKILFHTAGMVVLTVVVNGSSMRYLLLFLGFDTVPASKLVVFDQAVKIINESATFQEEVLRRNALFDCTNWSVARGFYLKPPKQKVEAASELRDGETYNERDLLIAEAQRRVLMSCRNSYQKQFSQGMIGHSAVKHLLEVTEEAMDKGCTLDEWDSQLVKCLYPLHLSGLVIRWEKEDIQRKMVHNFVRSPMWLLVVTISSITMLVLTSAVTNSEGHIAFWVECIFAFMTYVFATEICLVRPWAQNDLHAYLTDLRTLADMTFVMLNLNTIGNGYVMTNVSIFSWAVRGARFVECVIYGTLFLRRRVKSSGMKIHVAAAGPDAADSEKYDAVLRALAPAPSARAPVAPASPVGSPTGSAGGGVSPRGSAKQTAKSVRAQLSGRAGYTAYRKRKFSITEDQLGEASQRGEAWSWDNFNAMLSHKYMNLRRALLYPVLRKGFDVTSGFVRAREEALELLSDFLEDDPSLFKIKRQLEEDITSKQKLLFRLQRAYPDIASSMTTTQAAQAVLNKQQHTLSHLYHEGMLDKGEVDSLLTALHTKQKQLRFNPLQLNPPDKSTLLKQVPWIQELEGPGFEELLDKFEQVLLPGGSVVVEQGSLSQDVYVLVRGIVEIVRTDEDGDKIVIAELGIGSYFGEVSWAMNRPAMASVETSCSCVMYKISGTILTVLVEHHAEMRNSLWAAAGARVAEDLLAGRDGMEFDLAREQLMAYKVRVAAKSDQNATFEGQSVFHLRLKPNSVVVLLRGEATRLGKDVNETYQGPAVIKEDGKKRELVVRLPEGAIYMIDPLTLASSKATPRIGPDAKSKWGKVRQLKPNLTRRRSSGSIMEASVEDVIGLYD